MGIFETSTDNNISKMYQTIQHYMPCK